MSKNAKKIQVLTNRITQLESEMKEALQKKHSSKTAFDVPKCVTTIAQLRQDIKRLS